MGRHDLSSMRVEKGKAEVTLIVSAPGVATEDLEVLTLSNTIHVKGSSTANGEVWSVNQQISVAAHSDIDIESACATHANGVVTIRMKRKAGKNIPILKLQPDRVNLHEAHGQHTESIEKTRRMPRRTQTKVSRPSPSAPRHRPRLKMIGSLCQTLPWSRACRIAHCEPKQRP